MDTTSQKIKKIFDDNKINDLTRFIEKRQAINYCNIRLHLCTIKSPILGRFISAK